MKTKEKTQADKTVIQELRDIRDGLSMDMKDMDLEQIKLFLGSKETLHPKSVWQKNP